MRFLALTACVVLVGTGGPAARAASSPDVDALTASFLGGDNAAYWALRRGNPPVVRAVPALLRVARDPDHERRTEAIELLGWLGPAASSAVPTLVANLTDPDSYVQSQSHLALAKVDPAKLVAVYGGMLASAVESERLMAARRLARLGPAAKPAFPAILAAIENPKSEDLLRQDCIAAARAMGPAAAAAAPALRAFAADLRHPATHVAREALKTIVGESPP